MTDAAADRRARRPRRRPGEPIRWGRGLFVIGCVAAAVGLIRLFESVLPDPVAIILIDRYGPLYPVTVQNVMWIAFGLGFGELMLRLYDAIAETRQLGMRYLPEDERAMLQGPDLGALYAAARKAASPGGSGAGRFLPRLVQRVVAQFQSSRSIDQATAVMNSSLELYLHEIDLRYSLIRYIVWLIPTLGFVGTVIGISLALSFAGGADTQDPSLLGEITSRLAVAFNTTLLALLMSAVLVLLQHVIQAREERALNRAGEYCLDNLINRLYER